MTPPGRESARGAWGQPSTPEIADERSPPFRPACARGPCPARCLALRPKPDPGCENPRPPVRGRQVHRRCRAARRDGRCLWRQRRQRCLGLEGRLRSGRSRADPDAFALRRIDAAPGRLTAGLPHHDRTSRLSGTLTHAALGRQRPSATILDPSTACDHRRAGGGVSG